MCLFYYWEISGTRSKIVSKISNDAEISLMRLTQRVLVALIFIRSLILSCTVSYRIVRGHYKDATLY